MLMIVILNGFSICNLFKYEKLKAEGKDVSYYLLIGNWYDFDEEVM